MFLDAILILPFLFTIIYCTGFITLILIAAIFVAFMQLSYILHLLRNLMHCTIHFATFFIAIYTSFVNGSCMRIQAPPAILFAIEICPACSSTIFLTMANPKPVPCAFVVT